MCELGIMFALKFLYQFSGPGRYNASTILMANYSQLCSVPLAMVWILNSTSIK